MCVEGQTAPTGWERGERLLEVTGTCVNDNKGIPFCRKMFLRKRPLFFSKSAAIEEYLVVFGSFLNRGPRGGRRVDGSGALQTGSNTRRGPSPLHLNENAGAQKASNPSDLPPIPTLRRTSHTSRHGISLPLGSRGPSALQRECLQREIAGTSSPLSFE